MGFDGLTSAILIRVCIDALVVGYYYLSISDPCRPPLCGLGQAAKIARREFS